MGFRMEGATVLVTGANRGIGRALVETALAKGAKRVYAGARSRVSLDPLQRAHHDRVVALELDITDAGEISAAARSATDVGLVINNAGVVELLGASFDDAGWGKAGRREMDVNLFGTLQMTQVFAPILAANGGGALANVISVAAFAS